MIAWFARNHVAANLLMATILFAGFFSFSQRINLEAFPGFERDAVNVRVVLRGATPEDVEQGVSIRIEEAVQDLEGIEQITSQSVEGSATVRIGIKTRYDPKDMLAEIKSRVDSISTFPADAENPIISLAIIKWGVISVAIAGEQSEKEIREFATRMQNELLRIPGITHVELAGARNYEIAIEVSQHVLREYGLTLTDVANAIGGSSLDLSGGNIRTEGGDILIRSKGQAYRRDEFEDIVVKTNEDGSILRLSQIAQVRDDFEETPLRARFNGKNAVLLDVSRVGDQSALDVSDRVKQFIVDQQSSLPRGMEMSYWDDESNVLKNRLRTLVNSAVQGGLLVIILLALFLRPAIAFWVFIGIPVSFMGAFIVMPFFGVTLNVISLFSFILVLGILVDDAIVTGENVYRHLRDAESGLHAAIHGTREVATPVTFGILTTAVAFVPLTMIEGFRSAFFNTIPVVVIPILIFSLIESKFVLPSHLKSVKLRRDGEEETGFSKWQQTFADNFENAILKYYRPALKRCLEYRYSTIAAFAGVLLLLVALIFSGWTRFVFFPRIPSETARASLTMPAGTSFDITDRYAKRLTDSALELKEKYQDPETGESVIENIYAITGASMFGGANASAAEVHFEITPPERRTVEITSPDLVREWRQMAGVVPGAESLTFRAEWGRASDPISVQLSSTSMQQLESAAEKVKERIATYPEAFDISDNMSDGKQELQIELTEQGHAMGLTRSDIINQVRTAFYGAQVQRIQRGRDDIRVMVRFPIEERKSLSDLQDTLITAPGDRRIPLSHVAVLMPGKGPSAITRVDRFRTVTIGSDVNKEAVNMAVLQADLTGYLDELMTQYPGLAYSLEGEAKEQRESFGSLRWGLMFVLFAIYCLLAIPFKSYAQPLIVMSVIPFGAIGAVMGHWIMGMDLTLLSLLGMLALLGVVVNDSLVLVDFINKQVRSGALSLHEAVMRAGIVRFRPVMLTSLTTFAGLMPLLFEKSTQAQFLIPMAVSLGFGIIFATGITLILVPVNFLIVEDIRVWFQERMGRPQPVDNRTAPATET